MKREIEFRGLDVKTDTFVYGDLIHTPEGKTRIIGFVLNDTDYDHFNVMVIENTIGQYTGTTDSNETKIYEGDILEFEGYSDSTIIFMNGSFGYISDVGNSFVSLSETNLSIAVVSRNIHTTKTIIHGRKDFNNKK